MGEETVLIAGLVEGVFGKGRSIKITGMGELGLAISIAWAGYGLYKMLSNSHIKADRLPDINIGKLDPKS